MTSTIRDERTARGNGAKIHKILVDCDGYADLYRTHTAGPSGQRGDLLVGRAYYNTYDEDPLAMWESGYEIRIVSRGHTTGYANRTYHNGSQVWSIYADLESDGIRWWGYAETLSLGMDVLINGEHAATGRHDSQRISRGKWERNPYRAE